MHFKRLSDLCFLEVAELKWKPSGISLRFGEGGGWGVEEVNYTQIFPETVCPYTRL